MRQRLGDKLRIVRMMVKRAGCVVNGPRVQAPRPSFVTHSLTAEGAVQ
jgi:hypothetical protein